VAAVADERSIQGIPAKQYRELMANAGKASIDGAELEHVALDPRRAVDVMEDDLRRDLHIGSTAPRVENSRPTFGHGN